MWSYHFWEHPGRQIMDGLSKDAQRGQDKHDSEDDARAADRQTDRQKDISSQLVFANKQTQLSLEHSHTLQTKTV